MHRIIRGSEPRRNREDCSIIEEPLKYGDFLFPGKRTYEAKKQYRPDIVEFADVVQSDDYSIPLDELTMRLGTDLEKGLNEDQIISIRERYGDNALKIPKEVSFDVIKNRIRGTYYTSLAGIIFCITAVSMASLRPPPPYNLDNLYFGFVIVLMILLSASISNWQEAKSIRIMNSFKSLYPQYASVIRNGKKIRLQRKEIVVGDLVLLKAGNNIPADIRITEAWNLGIDELPLIRETSAAKKSPEYTSINSTVSENVALYGTTCIEGYGQGIATTTGDQTAYARMMKSTIALQKMDTTVYLGMRRVMKLFGIVPLAIGSIMFAFSLLRNYLWLTLISVVLAQTIASMPDILYSTITVCFYSAARRMVTKHCLPKDYEAVEKLGSITTICCDKTGTITQNRMTVVHVWLDGKIIKVKPSPDRSEMKLDPSPERVTLNAFLRAASLCSTITSKSRRNRGIIRKGCSCDQSEVAIMEFINYISGENSTTDFRQLYKKVFEIPFNSYKKYHVTISELCNATSAEDSVFLLCMKGAVEEILNFCSFVLLDGKNELMSELDRLDFQNIFQSVMKRGERVIGFCDYNFPRERYPHGCVFQEIDIPFTGLRFLGFICVMDPPRASVPEAIKRCRRAGIKVILTTGDHPITGRAIAKQVGIISRGSKTVEDVMEQFNITKEEVTPGTAKVAVVTGSEIESMEMEDLRRFMREYEEFVFARITPRQKIKLVESLQRDGEIVAVTGDSQEDSVAMHKADIGIGMGMHGCDISREVADVILLGDDFASIVSGIEEGRVIYDNLRTAMVYVLSSNVPEISPLVIVALLHVPFPMGGIFIVLISIISEMFPVLLIARASVDGDAMRKPRFRASNFFDHRIIHKSYCQVGVMSVCSGVFMYFVMMAENGFRPERILGAARDWNSPSINDFVDSYNQEWSYYARKSLEYRCQTGFFLSIIIFQFFHFVRSRYLVASLCLVLWQLLVILFLMHAPEISEAHHFYPIKPSDWVLCLPFPMIFLAFEEFRRFIVHHSMGYSWFERETI